MKLPAIRVSIAQINTTVGDLAGNQEKILRYIDQAKKERSDLVTFPELAITGYPPEDILFKDHFISENIRVLESLARETKGIMAVVGFVDRDKQKRLYNAAALISDQKVRYVYHKCYLPNYSVFDERRYFIAGSSEGFVDLGKSTLGITICEDIWLKESFVYQKSYSDKISLLVNISASPYFMNKQAVREKLVKDLATKMRRTVIYHNLVGGQDELVFDGGSMAIDASGKMIAAAKRFEEELLTFDLSKKKLSIPPKAPKTEEEVYKALVLGTRDYILKNRFKKVLIGLSGGIDSALVACIAVDALGADNVIGVTMPSPYTSNETYKDARKLAENLSIECLEFKIDDILDKYLSVFRDVFSSRSADTTEENIQARIRGNILMALSNKFGHLVLTTGNKSEMATGYCTLYGDMAGGFAVIKDVPKTLVFKLAKHRNSLSQRPSIPESIIKRPPTAELRHGQKDQDTLPPYDVLDRFLELYVENDLSVEKIARHGIPVSVSKKIARMVDNNEYKRRQSPPGVKITPKAFGKDRRMPITNRYSQ